MWIKMWKSYSEGPGKPRYYECGDEKDIEYLIEALEEDEYWDEGYHDILWEQIDKPPKEWLEKEIKEFTERSKNLYKDYRRTKIAIEDTIKNYKSLL